MARHGRDEGNSYEAHEAHEAREAPAGAGTLTQWRIPLVGLLIASAWAWRSDWATRGPGAL